LLINIYSLFNVKRINETLISNNDWNIINNNVLKYEYINQNSCKLSAL